ncbi:MAG: molybdopterin-dependent oxidoreductase [Acidobacteriota bacterium]|nr:molybdopterin-dependent oxidoreductase [Acidobacteriota bacterium]
MERSIISRRDFLKATAITGVGAAVAVGAYEGLKKHKNKTGPSKGRTGTVRTCCRACIANCGVIATVKNGRVVKVQGDPEYPMTRGALCAKGLAGVQALYNPNRNKYPMKRAGARGEGKWMRISWDEALDTVAKKLMETRAKYGAETCFCSTGGGGNPEFWSISRFCNTFDTPNWFEPGCAQCYLPRTLANALMYGGADISIADSNCLEIYFPEVNPVKAYVLWGTDPSQSCPAGGGRAMVELRAKGVKTVVIDPRLTPDAAKADVWLPVRPGTDVALMLAWIKYIIDHKSYDREFVMKWTNLPFLVNTETKMFLRPQDIGAKGDPETTFVVWDKQSNSPKAMAYPWDNNLEPELEGTFPVNGVPCKTGFQMLKERVEPYTLEKAAKICWLDVASIEKALKLYIETQPSAMSLGVATDQTRLSVQAGMAAPTIEMLMGHVEKPGANLQRFKSSGAAPILTYIVNPAKKLLSEKQLNKRLGMLDHKGLLQWWAAHPPTVLQAILTGKPYKPRVWIDRSGNKFAVLGNSSAWLPAIDQMDMIVHMYMYPTSFSAYADILLPAKEWLETDMIVESINKVFVRQAVTHLWETMDETLFWSKLAKRCADMGHENCKKAFDPKVMGDDMVYWDTMEELLDKRVKPALHMSWEELKQKSPVEFCSFEEWDQHYVYKRDDPKTGKPQGFDTPSKKLEIYLESLITLGRTGKPYTTYPLPPASQDYDPLPYYVEPGESPVEGEIGKQFPLVMTNGRLPIFHHGTLRNIPWLREIYPAPEIWINPVSAKKYGVSHGDWVWVESARGKTQARAHLTEGIGPGVVYMERYWNPETLNTPTHGWREMNVNVLSKNDPPFNDVVGTYTLRGYQVRVFKADGPPKGVWLKPEQFKPWLPEQSDPTPEVKV